jgi:hypothetical protein
LPARILPVTPGCPVRQRCGQGTEDRREFTMIGNITNNMINTTTGAIDQRHRSAP